MPEHILRTLRWLLGGLALVLTTPVHAADFYQGKTLTVIVGYAPGGGVDAGARAITRHLGRFIPGHPNIVVQNMEGAAGMVSLNHLDRRVAPDGLTLAVPGRSWYIEAIVRRPGIGVDPTRLTYIGSPGAVSAAGFVHARTAITTYAALKAATSRSPSGRSAPPRRPPWRRRCWRPMARRSRSCSATSRRRAFCSRWSRARSMARSRLAMRSPPVPISPPRWRRWCRPRRRARACHSCAMSCG